MAYPFVAARYFTRGAIAEVRATLWHMAEGTGTVSYLTHPPGNNSATYVIETTGRIVQMVRDGDASHSAHVAIDPDDHDASDCGIYDDAIARAVLGDGWRDINRYVVSVEVEGRRAVGPNARQVAAIVELSGHLRAKYRSMRGNLGHRDVQDYKSCPGCVFPWHLIGGHGPFDKETVMPGLATTPARDLVAGVARIRAGAEMINVETRERVRVGATGATRQAVGPIIRDFGRVPGYFVDHHDATHWVAESAADFTAASGADALAAQAARVRAAVDEALR